MVRYCFGPDTQVGAKMGMALTLVQHRMVGKQLYSLLNKENVWKIKTEYLIKCLPLLDLTYHNKIQM